MRIRQANKILKKFNLGHDVRHFGLAFDTAKRRRQKGVKGMDRHKKFMEVYEQVWNGIQLGIQKAQAKRSRELATAEA